MKKHYLFFLFILLISGCYYDNFQEMHPNVPANSSSGNGANCDSANITYTNHIKKIMTNYCVGCHNANNKGGGIALDTYSDVSNCASNNLYSSVIWDGATSQMPKGSTSKISDCSLKQIKLWINSGKTQ